MLVNFLKHNDITEIQRITKTRGNIYFVSFEENWVSSLYDKPRLDKAPEVQNIYDNILQQLKENPNGVIEVEI